MDVCVYTGVPKDGTLQSLTHNPLNHPSNSFTDY